jgi:predicted PurR-regulated permease PerM
MVKNLHPLVKFNLILLLLFLVFGGLYLASAFLIPMAFAGILAMVMTPLCVKLEAKGINKALASFLCILVLLLVVGGIGLLLSTQIANFTEDLPQIEQQINEQRRSIQSYVQETFGISPEEQKQAIEDKSSESGGMRSLVVGFFNAFTDILAHSLLALVYMFLLLFYRSRFPKFILKVVNEDEKEQARRIISESSQVAQQYLIGRGILILILSALYSIGLTVIGLDNAIFLSIIGALLSIIPYVGNIIALFLYLFMGLAQGDDSWLYINIFIVFAIVQFIESYLLEPYIVGAEVDIHPFFTVVIIIVGELIWGVAGMILAIPLLAIVKIIFSHIPSLEPYAYLIGDTREKEDSKTSEKVKSWFSGNNE